VRVEPKAPVLGYAGYGNDTNPTGGASLSAFPSLLPLTLLRFERLFQIILHFR
jgi:hypothetical protein